MYREPMNIIFNFHYLCMDLLVPLLYSPLYLNPPYLGQLQHVVNNDMSLFIYFTTIGPILYILFTSFFCHFKLWVKAQSYRVTEESKLFFSLFNIILR